MRSLWLLAILGACGDNITDASSVQGGSRLQLVHFVYDDGTREWDREAFHDAVRNERCVPVLYSDGLRYCTPETAGGETVFVDAGCTRSLGLAPADASAPLYFVRYFDLLDEVRPSRLYRSGARTTAPSLIWTQQDGFCLGPIEPRSGWYYELGEEVLPADLVRIRQLGMLAGERLAVGIDSSGDGLHVPGTFYDRDLTRTCSLSTSANASSTMCIPDELPTASYYADAACAQPVLAMPTGQSADLAKHVVPQTACGSLVRVGDLLPMPMLYTLVGPSCVAVSPPGGSVFFATGATLDLAAAERIASPLAAGRRLATIDIVHGPLRVPDRYLFDRELGGDCRRELRDGEYRCVPHAAVNVQTVFADDACSTTVKIAFVPGDGCHLPALFASDGHTRYPVGDPYAQPFYELEPGDRCGTFEAPTGFVAHALQPAIPDSAFARAVVETPE